MVVRKCVLQVKIILPASENGLATCIGQHYSVLEDTAWYNGLRSHRATSISRLESLECYMGTCDLFPNKKNKYTRTHFITTIDYPIAGFIRLCLSNAFGNTTG
jgi:hypothetical protein